MAPIPKRKFADMQNTKQTKATNTNVSYDVLTVAKSIGQNIFDLHVSVVKTIDLTKTLQETADKLRSNGVTFGKSIRTCTWRATIADTIERLCKDKAAKKTCMNYVTSFVNAVNTGSAFSLSDSKGKAKGKGKETAKPEFSALLAKAFSHTDFANVIAQIQADFVAAYDADESPNLATTIQDYLESEGFEIAE
jgi:ketopantoate reductase